MAVDISGTAAVKARKAPRQKSDVRRAVAASGAGAGWLAAGLALFVIATGAALLQDAPPPGRKVESGSVNWWLHPPPAPLQQIGADLYSVFALGDAEEEAEKVWAVGNLGLIVHSAAGGRTWRRQSPGGSLTPAPALAKAAFRFGPLAGRVYAAEGAEATGTVRIKVLIDGSDTLGGGTAVSLRSGIREYKSVYRGFSPDGTFSIFTVPAGDYEIIASLGYRLVGKITRVVVEAGGEQSITVELSETVVRSAQQNQQGRGPNVEQLAKTVEPLPKADEPPILAVEDLGAVGVAYLADVFGLEEEPPIPALEDHLRGVYFESESVGWAAGLSGGVLRTTNGGQEWRPDAESDGRELLDGLRAQDAWALDASNGAYRLLYRGAQGAQPPRAVSPTPPIEIRGLWVGRGDEVGSLPAVVVVGLNGQIRRLENGADPAGAWSAQESGATVDLYGVHFLPDDRRGWAVGAAGAVLNTRDGGVTWVAQSLGAANAEQAAVPFPLAPELAPWYYLSLLAVGLLLVPAFRKQPPVETEQESVADRLVSDRPLEKGDPDPLQFNAVAQGLSRFLRNENTTPPLTVAVTGEWGTGKSSLMNLLRADLEEFQFRTVWFNAWHHQKEESLLAALLQNIRLQAVPPLWRPQGWTFRLRLFSLRGWKSWQPVILLLVLAAVPAGHFFQLGENRLAEAWYLLTHLFGLLGEKPVNPTGAGSLFTSLAAAYLMLVTAGRKLSAFGLSPAALLHKASESGRIRRLEAKTSFRFEFGNEFRDVTRALGKQRMVVFVDDLDRCSHETVVETLEAVNFLVTSGECFVVMGLDRKYVECAVGLNFHKVADEMATSADSEPPGEGKRKDGRAVRAHFARQYLQKLINIETPVPEPKAEQSLKLLAGEEEGGSVPDDAPRLAWARRIAEYGGRAAVAAGVVLALGLSFQSGGGLARLSSIAVPAQEQAAGGGTGPAALPPVAGADGSGSSVPEPRGGGPSAAVEAVDASGQQPVIDQPRESSFLQGTLVRWPALAALYVLLSVVHLILTRRPDLIVKDSPEFTAALRIWHPLVIVRQNTPRAVKRYMNRVRYLAMRHRPSTATYSLSSRIFRALGFERKEPPAPVPTQAIPEPALVALAAIHHFDPAEVKTHSERAATLPVLADCLKRHAEQFPEEDLSLYTDAFEAMSMGIKVN